MKQVVLLNLSNARFWKGHIGREIQKNSPIVVTLDGEYEYVTSPVKRVLRLLNNGKYYLQTSHSTYSLTILEEK